MRRREREGRVGIVDRLWKKRRQRKADNEIEKSERARAKERRGEEDHSYINA